MRDGGGREVKVIYLDIKKSHINANENLHITILQTISRNCLSKSNIYIIRYLYKENYEKLSFQKFVFNKKNLFR